MIYKEKIARFVLLPLKCLVIYTLCNFSACNTAPGPGPGPDPRPILAEFEGVQTAGEIDNLDIDEASGLIASNNLEGYFWTHNDSGDLNRIFLIDKTAKWKGTYYLNGAENRDWEDIAIDKAANNENYLYLADIGDNFANYNNSYVIYKVKEPNSLPTNIGNQYLDNIEKIRFKYPDGSRDAETLLIDHATKDMYIVTKREAKVRVYQLPYPQSTTVENTAIFIAELPFGLPLAGVPTGATAGDISTDNTEIIIKNYFQIFYWKLAKNETIKAALSRSYDKLLPYTPAAQEEGISFGPQNNGYYTIGEAGDSKNIVKLYFYKRK
jgi:hypothetical protein